MTEGEKKLLEMVGEYASLTKEEQETYRKILKLMFPQQFKDIKESE